VGRDDKGKFLFLNLKTAEPVWTIPPAPRLRISREKFRKLLAEDLDVSWGKSFVGFETTDEGVTAHFEDGSSYKGRMIVGAEGRHAKVRKALGPSSYELRPLPIRVIGVTVRLNKTQMAPLKAIDPLLFQGCHPDTSTYLWFSILDTPENNGSEGTGQEYWSEQVIMSWPVEKSGEVPGAGERLKRMKELVVGVEQGLRKLVEGIPEETEALEIRLGDWPCLPWDDQEGKVTLVGDSAHAMTMCKLLSHLLCLSGLRFLINFIANSRTDRGEAANHGLKDAALLLSTILKIEKKEIEQKSGIEAFEKEMRERTKWAVEMSRQACLDAHDFKSLGPESAILKRRAIN
jgi:2-polyprenyl-6-methoxyphenol hydroxylase-like FAD-dependent oxidoreductase